jgi:MFS family permease
MNCACKNFASLVALRVLLGCFESAVAPSLILITGMWYKKNEQPFRILIWYLGTGCGTIVGALFSYEFQHYTGKTSNRGKSCSLFTELSQSLLASVSYYSYQTTL